MRSAGIEWTRTWFSWASVEAVRGEYDWSRPDALVEAAAEEGLSVLPMLFGSPEWVGQARRAPVRRFRLHPVRAAASTATRDAFARFAGAAVRRYGPDGGFWSQHPGLAYRPIRVWQIWNEQNMNAFFRPVADAERLRRAAVARPRRRCTARTPGRRSCSAACSGPEAAAA